MMKFVRSVPLLVGLAALAPFALAESGLGHITGTVTDSGGAFCSNDEVVLERKGSRELRRTQTDRSGGFEFTALKPGYYRMTVNAIGFKPYKTRWVRVQQQQERHLNIEVVANGSEATGP